MKIFEHFNSHEPDVCPICKTNVDKPVVLIPILGTEEDNNIQAIQVHDDCLTRHLYYSKEMEQFYVI